MRGLLPFLLFLPAAVAAACATSSPITESNGGSTGAGTPGVTSGGGATGVRGCGMINPDPACSSCIEASCCSPAEDCASDATCLACLGQPVASEDCIVYAPFSALEACLADRCAGPCATGGTSSGSTSTSGGGSGGSTSSSTTSSTSSGTAATTTSSSASSTTSSSSSGATSSSSGASSSTSSSSSSTTSSSSSSSSSSGGHPTTCAGADGDVGCCNPDGVLYFCDVHQVLYSEACAGGSVCGWSQAEGFYDCVSPPGGADPSDTYPLACGGP